MVAIVRRNAWGARTSVPYRPLTAAARFVVWHYPGGTVGNDGAAVTPFHRNPAPQPRLVGRPRV